MKTMKTGGTFAYLSRKWTNKNDAFLTFWGHDSAGYRWFQGDVGEYKEPCETPGYKDDPVANVDFAVVLGLFESCLYAGRIVKGVLNTPENRKALGITLKDLQKIGRNCCPKAENIASLRLKPGADFVRTSDGQVHQIEAVKIIKQ